MQLGLVYDPYQVAHDNDMMWYDTHIVVLWPTIDHQQQQSNCIALEKTRVWYGSNQVGSRSTLIAHFDFPFYFGPN